MNSDWSLTPRQAMALQKRLARQVIIEDRFHPVSTIAGTDVGFEDNGAITRAAVAVLSYPGLELLDWAIARRPTTLPYIPGLLSFRELPAVIDALDKISTTPDLTLCDGQGIAHPRRLGIASHLGVLTGLATIGVGKSRLLGTHAEVGEQKGSWVALEDNGDTIGAVVRTRTSVRPLYISSGHRVCLQSAIDWVLNSVSRYRLPEPIRWADGLASGHRSAPTVNNRRQSQSLSSNSS